MQALGTTCEAATRGGREPAGAILPVFLCPPAGTSWTLLLEPVQGRIWNRFRITGTGLEPVRMRNRFCHSPLEMINNFTYDPLWNKWNRLFR